MCIRDRNDVERAANKDDQVIIDFIGKINGEEFEGNSAKDFKLVLGSNSMIPGFEDSIIGKKSSKFTIQCKFPDDYFKKDLAGVEANFDIDLKQIQEIKEANINKELRMRCPLKKKNSRKSQCMRPC